MLKAGILGGGQLGRMLLQAAANYPVETFLMENDPEAPAAHLCHHFTQGDIRNFEDVYNFGKDLDAITIEIESVNVEALEKLESSGVKIYPKPSALKTIKNKIAQKRFYQELQVPSPSFIVTENKAAVTNHESFLPAVHKLAEGGYDGRGVQVLRKIDDFPKAFDAPAVLEKMINIKKEIAQIVAVSNKGEFALYPPIDMVFDPHLNLLDYQISPADIDEKVRWKIEGVSLAVVKGLASAGVFAVELFIDVNNDVFVNETAPRVHNSGHHTIEAHFSSQFDMLWRIILNYPLGNTKQIFPSVMINIIGSEGHTGTPLYEGINDVLLLDNTYIHIYGKHQTKPGRKMGHITILSHEKQDLIYNANRVKQLLSVVSR